MHFRRTRWSHAAFLFSSLATVVAAGCSSDDEATAKSSLASACTLNSDCAGGLACTFGKCHSVCAESKDCPTGARCVGSNAGAVCQQQTEAKCTYASDCADPLVCAVDQQCRNQGVTDKDCAAVKGQKCTQGVCADTTELNEAGELPVADGGTGDSDAGNDGGELDAGQDVSVDASSDTGGDVGPDGSVDEDSGPSGEAGADVGADTTADADAPCGRLGEACCAEGNPCLAPKTTCSAGTCVGCGGEDQACCGATCGANLTCAAGVCTCGGKGQACCAGTACSDGFACTAGQCTCGQSAGDPCCGDSTCGSSTLTCAGLKCTCLVACSGAIGAGFKRVLRTDGSYWQYDTPSWMRRPSSSPALPASARHASWACGLKSGNALCWGNSTYGLGDGLTTSSETPVKVRESAGGALLTNLIDLDVGNETACVVDAGGSVRCWGGGTYGQLGNGYEINSDVPVQVMASSSTPLANIDQVRVGSMHACAHAKDNTLWCWGYNSSGQIGTGSSQDKVLYATQVTDLLNTVTEVSCGERVSCARTTDGTAWCWGDNSAGQLATGIQTGSSNTPVQVEVTPGGGPVSNVVKVLVANQAAYLVKQDGSLWGWGSYTGHLSPEPATTDSSIAIRDVFYLGVSNTTPCIIRKDGTLWGNGSGSQVSSITPPECP